MSAITSLRVESPSARDVATQPTLSALKTCSWFAGWPQGALVALASACSLRSFGAGEVVLGQGKPVATVALVVKGRIRAVRRGDGGREVTLENFRPGELCLDGIFHPQGILPNDWVAGETSLLLFMPRDEFLAQLRVVPETFLALAREMERRLVRSKLMAASLALSDVQARLHDVLAGLARDDGEPTAEGTLIRRSPTQQEIGNMIGACRETVSRMVADLVRQGMVMQRGRRLLITPRFLAATAVAGDA
jgi:CRP-like cAMP-binding protein